MLQRIVSNISWLFFDKIVRLGMGLIVGIWVARYLGPSNYGLLNYAIAIVALFAIFVKLGLQSIVVRDLVNDPRHSGEIVGTAIVIQIAGAALAYGLLILIISNLQAENATIRGIVALLGLTLFAKAFDTAKYWFEAGVMSKYIVWLSNTVFLVLSAVRVVLVLIEAPLIAFVWVLFVDAIVVSFGAMFLFFYFGPSVHALRFKFERARLLITDSWPLFLSGAAVIVYMKIDVVMLGQLATDKEVGIYTAATKVSELWYFVPTIIVTSVFPAILNAKKHSKTLYYRRFQQLFDLMSCMGILVACTLSLISGWLIILLFGESYAEAGSILTVYTWASIFVFLGTAGGRWFVAQNRQILNLQRTALAAVVNIVLNLLLIPYYGGVGAAWATLVAHAIGGFMFDALQRETRVLFFMKLAAVNPIGVISRLRRTWKTD